jgi:NAD(P)H dehydrogenase (quinone)
MSQISARRIAKSHAAQNHWIAERLLDRSEIPVTHLRPTFFAEWLEHFSESIREKDMFPLPFGEARYAPIAAEEQGRGIAAILNALSRALRETRFRALRISSSKKNSRTLVSDRCEA